MWFDNVRMLVRIIINDMVEPYEYSDSRINTLIIHAAKIMVNELSLCYNIDLCNNIVTPDPSSDDNFLILTAYKTACMFAAAEVKTYSMSAISVTDGPSSINFGGAAAHAQKRYEDLCDQYEEKKLQFLVNNNCGRIISGPIPTGGYNNGCC